MVRRVLAPNPGEMTGPGTNTYLVGIDEIAVVDPGPDDAEHLDTVAACGGDRIRWILVTHTHNDHAPGVVGLQARTGATVMGFDQRDEFAPDETIGDGFCLEATEFRLLAVHTPGHASNHLCYLLEQERMLFSGDHIMQGSTVVIAPPDGDMAAYVAALQRLKTLRIKSIAPGHGHLIEDPSAKIDEYLTHRGERERAILQAVADGAGTVNDVVERVYVDVPEHLHPIARFSVHAHLLKLSSEGKVQGEDLDGEWSLAAK
ncbi:MAG: MBL fold metallo-hydrolase [Acidimicrobiia bacterium]|nr:MBL fold metallo-hydrolase [Acidimicrobiia bacterium]